MDFSRFFIDRPIFAAVISMFIFIAGLLSVRNLPVSEFPGVVPPSVQVRAQYPGANPQVLAETVATPLEEQINGVEDMLYMSSQSTADGSYQLTVTFKVGTDVDKAETQVQSRVQRALPRMPEEVRRIGVVAQKSSASLTMVVSLVSPDGRYDELYQRNYAVLNIKNRLQRIDGMGLVDVFGGGDYAMRIWLQPPKLASYGLTASDVVQAIREQNVQVAAGVLGAPPSGGKSEFQLNITAKGRLTDEDEFGQIIVKSGASGLVRLKDVARLEMGGNTYTLRSFLNGKPSVAIGVFQSPTANALDLSDEVRAAMEELKRDFPPGLSYDIVYDPTQFVRTSIEAVVTTLFEAIMLVVLVVIVFLQTWRASIIPLVAVPVSIVGTFGLMMAFGFSINTLTLFGMVLAVGIVVDDAIVVVENVERNIANGLTPVAATHQAMKEVSGPIIATALVLCAVFVPTAFVSGLTGQFYNQFALTIAISTVISTINSLTLSPALAAVLLKPHDAKKDFLQRGIDAVLGWFFRRFNRFFSKASVSYEKTVGRVIGRKAVVMLVYGGLIVLTVFMFGQVPKGFVPQQDKQYLVGFTRLPDGASLDRTESVIRRMTDIGLKHPAVKDSVAFAGLSINGFTVSPNEGIAFFGLKDFKDRHGFEQSLWGTFQKLNGDLQQIQDGFVMVFPPPAVEGLGTIGGFRLQLEDRGNVGFAALAESLQMAVGKAYQTPALAGVFSSYTINVPQIFADVDREKAKRMGVALNDIFDTLQINLGSLYVNDFNRFGRTYQVVVQADAPFRMQAESIGTLKTRTQSGSMVQLSSLLKATPTNGPDRVQRYNSYVTADINGGPAPGYSSGQAQAAIAKILDETLPKGIAYEWTDLTYQEILAGNTMVYVFPLCVLLVFLVLAAQYESLRLPLAVILIVPMCLLFAILGVWLTVGEGTVMGIVLAILGANFPMGDNNIFTQIAFIVLVGLACKNAILIVEFARELEHQGKKTIEAALIACRLRLRPILMTSFAFIMGVIPLVLARGAGAEMRQAIGIAVFAGMVGVTLFGLFMTPVFYVLLGGSPPRKREPPHPPAPVAAAEEGAP
ncbi:MAG: efflux RND transporter permease subunit [Betaproteobacteria bacterium]|nr:efflux RND transporter permease subunit [Betaproteobacteria bacterium]